MVTTTSAWLQLPACSTRQVPGCPIRDQRQESYFGACVDLEIVLHNGVDSSTSFKRFVCRSLLFGDET